MTTDEFRSIDRYLLFLRYLAASENTDDLVRLFDEVPYVDIRDLFFYIAGYFLEEIADAAMLMPTPPPQPPTTAFYRLKLNFWHFTHTAEDPIALEALIDSLPYGDLRRLFFYLTAFFRQEITAAAKHFVTPTTEKETENHD